MHRVEALNDFDSDARRRALEKLVACESFPQAGSDFNMHCHSFFSYNAQGWSPTRLAYECRKRALSAVGLCDFDVLDGLEEFLAACRLLELRGAVHLETRAFVRELAEVDISSPGEPGVTYIMGCGFSAKPDEGTPQAETLAALRQGALERNSALIERINQELGAIAIDYTRDVLPLTPKGVATERHIMRAYRERAQEVFTQPTARIAFWSPLLKCTADMFVAVEADVPKMEELIRSALAKRGGIGYVPPNEKTFPAVDDFTAWVRACGAIPTVAWLDGTTRGEESCEALLDLLCDKGCAAVNIIPDRNWNLKESREATLKQAKLEEVVRQCVKRDLPINIGTEMNKGGLPFVDRLSGPVLKHYALDFIRGMQIMVGQTLLARYANAPYLGERAVAEFPKIDKRNAFYAAVGAQPAVTEAFAKCLIEAGGECAFGMLADAARRS